MTLPQRLRRIPGLKFSFSKSTEFSQAFARDCGALSMYNAGFGPGIPANLSSENKLRAVFVQIAGSRGTFLFNLSGVDMKKARRGFRNYDEAESNNQITEWELFTILSNSNYFKKLNLSQRQSRIQKAHHMELGEKIVGTRLNEIQKKSDDVKLIFEDTKSHKLYVLTFKGLLFETSSPTLNKRVKDIHLSNTLGFRAMSQLRQLNREPGNYRQLFIEMEGSSNDNKSELLGALRSYKISPRKSSISRARILKKTSSAAKTSR